MQVSPSWTPPAGTLGELVAAAHARVRTLLPRREELERAAYSTPAPPAFADVLKRGDVTVIAELKRRSPSRGAINPGLQVHGQAVAYVTGGAAALSVLTEPDRFGGVLDDLVVAARAVTVPLLRKDFLVHRLQLVEARLSGAAAVLLIVRALDPGTFAALVDAARELLLEPLVEVRDEAELERALEAGARVVGVNSRDLETLRIDPTTAARIVPRIPASVIAVAESGITGRDEVSAAATAGADAVLVGTALSAAADPSAAVRALTGVRNVRGAVRGS